MISKARAHARRMVSCILLLSFGFAGQGQAGFSVKLTVTPTTCGYGYGVILAVTTGGTAPFKYTLNGVAQPTNVFTGLKAGAYTVVVQDNTNQSRTVTATVTNTFEHPLLSITSSTQPSACDAADGTITLKMTPGAGSPVPPYSYSSDGVNYSASNTLIKLRAGQYTLYVRDGNSCFGSIAFSMKSPCPGGVSVTTSKPICGPGTVTATPVGGAGIPFQYSTNGTDFTAPISGAYTSPNLNPGRYVLYARDNTRKVFTYVFTISQSCTLPITATTTASHCADKNGTITIAATGGVKPIFYTLLGRNFQESNVITGLGPGYYIVQAKDASGNLGQLINVHVLQDCPVLNVESTPSACNANTGTITVVNATGTPPITYSLDGVNYQANTKFSNLAPGDYTVTSKAGNTLTTADINVPTVEGPDLTATATPAGCTVVNGTITSIATGGLEPYNFQINGGPRRPNGDFNALKAGLYTISVTDDNGCSAQQQVSVPTSTGPTLTLTSVAAGCSVGNGSITAIADGGTAPFSYQLDGKVPQETGDFPGLTGGTYSVTITDANGCTDSKTITIGTAVGPSLTATSKPATCAGNDGEIVAEGNAGAGGFLYSLDKGTPQTSGTFSGVSNGTHTVSVTDANGCGANQDVTVALQNTVQVDAGADVEFCAGSSTVLRGTSNSATNWSPGNGLSDPNSLTPTASPTTTTKYFLTAVNGVCKALDSVVVTVDPLPFAHAGNDTTICYGDNAKLNGSGGVSFSWTPSAFLDNDHSQNPTVSAPIETTIYMLSVTDANGCTSATTDAVMVTVTPLPLVSAGPDTSVLAGIPFSLHASDINGSGFNQYSWNPATGLDNPKAQSPTANLPTPAVYEYSVVASTAQGCSATDNVTIKVFKEADLFVPNAFTPNNDGVNDILHVIPIGIKEFHYFRVYNRQGQLVFNTADPGQGWDGRIVGITPSTGGYVWAAEGLDYEGKLLQRQGTVVLIR